MSYHKSGSQQTQQRIALERIAELFLQAEKNFVEYPKLSDRYVVLARKIAMRYKVRFNDFQKRLFCKGCSSYLKPGVNSTLRLVSGRIVLRCVSCGHVRRFGYKPLKNKLDKNVLTKTQK